MGLTNFQIVFDNPLLTYYSGQQVSGRVLIGINEAKKIRAINIKIKGRAEVKFSESHKGLGSNKSHTVRYSSNETYFEHKNDVLGNHSGEYVLPVGDHCYPFSTNLPLRLPSSFEGKYGHVRYTVKCTIDIPWKFDKEVKAAFTVISPLDLNLDITNKLAVRESSEKFFGCCCCQSAPLYLTGSLPTTGFVPGQVIPIGMEVKNTSDQEVGMVTCALMKRMMFHGDHITHGHHSKWHSETVAELSVYPGEGNGSGTWSEQLSVPPVPPSNLDNCNIIDVRYELEIIAHVASFCHKNLNLIIPVTLGTIPLLENFPGQPFQPDPVPLQFQPFTPAPDHKEGPLPGPQPGMDLPPPYPSGPVNPNGTPMPSAPVGWHMPGMLYPHLPPPSFEEATYGAKTIHDEDDSTHIQGEPGFTPRYPSYNFAPSAPPMK